MGVLIARVTIFRAADFRMPAGWKPAIRQVGNLRYDI